MDTQGFAYTQEHDHMNEQQERRLRDELIPALRSGKYEQGQGALAVVMNPNDPPRHCCLGVACDVMNPDGWRDEPEIGRRRMYGLGAVPRYADRVLFYGNPDRDETLDDMQVTLLPYEAQCYYGLSGSGEWVRTKLGTKLEGYDDMPQPMRGRRSLVDMNDAGASFEEIAGAIEHILDHPALFRFMDVPASCDEPDEEDDEE